MANILEKVPPQSIEAEMAVIGAMLIEKEAVTKVLDVISEKDFYKDLHKQIFVVARDLYLENQPVEIITVADKLKKNAMFEASGSMAYLTQIIDSVQTAANIEHYAQIVRDKSILRQLVNAGSEIATDAFNERYSPEDILDRSQGALFNISQSKNTKGLQKISEFVRPALKNLERLHSDKRDIPGLRTGFSDVDQMTAGLQNSELIILAARPSMGKTALALNIAENVALDQKKPVAIFSLEMSAELLMIRFLASRARLDAQKLRKGQFDQSSWSKITSVSQQISEAPLYIEDDSSLSVIELRARARRLASELEAKKTPLSLVVVDYLQLMRGAKNAQSREQEIADISRSLKGLARDLKVPVIALSQLSRKTEERGRKDNKPQLSDLRESGAIEQDADVVAFIYREGYYNREDPEAEKSATLIIGKQRNGPTGEVDLIFERQFTKFYDKAK